MIRHILLAVLYSVERFGKMSKTVNALDGLTLSDLMSPDGITLDIGNEYFQEEEEEFSYSSDAFLSNEEVLNMLNIKDIENDNDEDNEVDEATAVMPCNISFDKLKTRMTDLMGNQMVMKLIKRSGTGVVVPDNAQVTIKYIGYFEYNDEPFDSTYAHGNPHTVRLGKGLLIPGLEIGISSMQKHEIAMFIINPKFAYGELGCVPRIPPNAEVMFAVHLVDFLDNGTADTYENLSIEEKKLYINVKKRANDMLNIAKDSFTKNKIKAAIREYNKAINWIEQAELRNEEDEQDAKAVLSKAYNNLAICYNRENMLRHACSACNKVPMPTAKTYFNRGKALRQMGEYDDALRDLQKARSMASSNQEIYKEICLTNQQRNKYLAIEKRLWANCIHHSNKKKQTTEFEKAAREMCESFACDSQLSRHPLPEGLTPEEEKYIRAQAAAFGILVTNHVRYGKEIVYLNKPNF